MMCITINTIMERTADPAASAQCHDECHDAMIDAMMNTFR